MPTGYTSILVDNEDATFEDYAKRCMRAFGATIHMRDKSLNIEWEPAEASNYHLRMVEKNKKKLEEIRYKSADEVAQMRENGLKESINYYNKYIKKRLEVLSRLNRIKKEAEEWTPPTAEHEKFKRFMISQINDTIDFDCDVDYLEKGIIEYETQLNELDGEEEKRKLIENYKNEIQYHQKEYEKEIERVNSKNKWVRDVLNSLKDENYE